MPRISIIMPVYNAEAYLEESIKSILAQSFIDFEFIIINDGSTDNSSLIINKYASLDKRIRSFQQVNKGLSFTLNYGLKLASSNFIARMDADDIAMPNRLDIQYDFLNKNIDYIVIGSNAIAIDNNGNKIGLLKRHCENEDLKKFLPGNPFIHSSVIFNKNIISGNGGYNENVFQFFEDKLLWAEVADKGKYYNIQEPLIYYRISPNSISNYSNKQTKYIESIITRYLENKQITHLDKEFINKLRFNKSSRSKKRGNYYFRIGVILRENERYLKASFYFLCSWFFSFLQIKRVILSLICFINALKVLALNKKFKIEI